MSKLTIFDGADSKLEDRMESATPANKVQACYLIISKVADFCMIIMNIPDLTVLVLWFFKFPFSPQRPSFRNKSPP